MNTTVVMQHAVKLALVDPRHLQYRDLAKKPEDVVKADMSLDIMQILNNPSLPDDLKMKMYNQTLDRFLRTSSGIPDGQVSKLPPINYEESIPPAVTPRRRVRKKAKLKSATPTEDYKDLTLDFMTPTVKTTPVSAASTLESKKKVTRKSKRLNNKPWVNWK